MNARILTVALVGFLAGQPSFAADGDVSGLLSTFLSEKSDDISGPEIRIVPNPKGYSVQASEGAPRVPKRADVRRQKTGPPRHEGTRMYKVYKAIGDLATFAAFIVGVGSSMFFFVSLFRGRSRFAKTIISIVVWIAASLSMFYPYFIGGILIEGWNQKDEGSALYGALVLMGSTAVYAGLAYALIRWIEKNNEPQMHAPSAPPS